MRLGRPVAAVALVAALFVISACGGVGRNAVSSGSTEFQFVAPGGQTRLLYDPPDSRGHVSGLSGEDLLVPGRTTSLEQFAGRVVVLNVWGSWCGPCRAEMPDLQQVYERTRAQGVTLLGIDVRDDRQAARDFITDRSITYPSIYDNPGRSLLALRGFPRNTVPSTIVLDRSHRVAAAYLTAVRVDELLPVVQRVAAEPPPAPPNAPASGAAGATTTAGTG